MTDIQTNTYNEFGSFCKNLNDICRAKQEGEKEFVNEATAFRALAYVKYMSLESAGDVILFGAAMNVLNTFVKQPGGKKTLGYFFKNSAVRLADQFVQKMPEGIEAKVYIDRGMNVFQVSVCGIQFSFHCVPKAESILAIQDRTDASTIAGFDGIRKQMCANTFFEAAENNHLLRSNTTVDGESLNDKLSQLVSAYMNNEMSLQKLKYCDCQAS